MDFIVITSRRLLLAQGAATHPPREGHNPCPWQDQLTISVVSIGVDQAEALRLDTPRSAMNLLRYEAGMIASCTTISRSEDNGTR